MQINLTHHKKYLLACSFGPDSMALLSLLQSGGYSFVIAHVNYMMRDAESEAETSDLKAYAAAHNIPLFIKYIEGKKIVGNFQSEARKLRYEFFKEVSESEGCDTVLTAHHLDDHLETYLLQTTRKQKTFHYGIKAETVINNVHVFRPLLAFTKAQIMHYITENNIPYAIDSSNLLPKYTRNILRIKTLKNMDYAAKMALIREIEARNAVLNETENSLSKLIFNNTIMIKDLLSLTEEDQEYLLYLLFGKVGLGEHFSRTKAMSILNVAQSPNTSMMSKIISSFYLVKFEEKLTIIDKEEYRPFAYKILEPLTLETPYFSLFFAKENTLPKVSEEDYPLTVRNAVPGDTYKIKNYTKKVERLFIDMKLPRHYRLVWPVVLNNEGEIIYIPRYRQNYVPKNSDLMRFHLHLGAKR